MTDSKSNTECCVLKSAPRSVGFLLAVPAVASTFLRRQATSKHTRSSGQISSRHSDRKNREHGDDSQGSSLVRPMVP